MVKDRDCGSNNYDSLTKCDLLGLSLKMFLLCASEEATSYCLDWKESATPFGRSWWVLGRSALRTKEIGSGSSEPPENWQTPQSSDNRRRFTVENMERRAAKGKQPMLSGQVEMWSTPRSSDGTKGPGLKRAEERGAHREPLSTQAVVEEMWPTPRASAKGNATTKPAPTHGKSHGKCLAGEVNREYLFTCECGEQSQIRLDQPCPHCGKILSGEATEILRGENWRTPTVNEMTKTTRYTLDGGDPEKKRLSLIGQIEHFPTPQARDWRDGKISSATQGKNSRPLNEFVVSGPPDQETSSTGGKSHGQLNPAWVAQLLGYPKDYYQKLERAVSQYWETVGNRKSRS